MKRLIISISILLLLASFSLVPTFAGIYQMSEVLTLQKELVNPDSEDTATAKTNYVAELNKIGMAGRPESNNAAPYYQKAIALYVQSGPELANNVLSRTPQIVWPTEVSAKHRRLLKEWLRSNSGALSQLELGAIKPYYWVQRSSPDGTLMKMQMPGLAGFRQLCFAIAWRAKLAAAEGKMDKAAADIVTCYRLGLHVGVGGPKFLTEQLVGIAIRAKAVQTAFEILDRTKMDAPSMQSLQSQIEQLSADESYIPDMRAEKFSMLDTIQTIFTDDGKGDGRIDMESANKFIRDVEAGREAARRVLGMPSKEVPSFEKLQRRETVEAVEKLHEYFDFSVQKSPWQWKNEKIDPDKELEKITEENALVQVLCPPFRIAQIFARYKADSDGLITTLALLRYKAEQGGLPEKVDNLVSAGYLKAVPTDPFSDNAFVYKRRGNDFMLYSFGVDCDDDGGQVGRSPTGRIRKWADAGDAVFWPVEQPQMAERPSGRERPFARPERPQRRATSFTRSAAQPYLIDDDDEEEYVPAQPRPRQQKRTKTLHDAARGGDVDQVQLLLSKGADVNEKNSLNWTPLHTAVQNFKQEVIEPLIANGADVNAKNDRGLTPLHVAVNTSQKDAVELLIAEGADVNVMGNRGDNALSLANKRGNKEIIDLLLKHGAKEPIPQNLMEDRYYEEGNSYPGPEEQGTIRRGTRAFRGSRTVSQSPVQVDILADPNGIKARIKMLGLQKALEEVAGKSQNEMRQWQQKRYDNRTLLIRTVQKQFDDEIGVIRKVAVEEKAKKTTAAIDGVLSGRKERFSKVSKELLAQKRELRQMQPARGRGRARTSGRSTRGRTSQRGQPYGGDMTEPLYGRGGVMPGTSRYQSARGPSEQIDIEAENEIRQWLQTNIDNKGDLAEAVHEQIWVEISSIRIVAVEEEAKKTTATIDGLLLYRQTRFEAFINKMEEEKRALQQAQDPRTRGRGRYPQDGQMQQQNQPRTRGRRR